MKDNKGKLFELEQEFKDSSKENLLIYRVELEGNAWKKVDVTWTEQVNKLLNSKNVTIDQYSY